ncbi:hypothetical protein DCS_04575 [Drechmeria coniospora]|uniref:Carboxypeptidase n=1 Tax=Drechmeria coniospora TaxID=98403 RepID=A0A151GKD4_DRECN|nr:hypothetical protein DCS_04575 [Drechmeria coniospora]KYK57564.1 hypothetical protein DCS_04575 [Drechmeria coniospora]
MRLMLAALLLTSSRFSHAQFIHRYENARNLTVKTYPGNVTVSFKEPRGVCNTASDAQKQYTGWVSVPNEYPTNIFFYFVEARNATDNLTVWINGGPGASSMYGFFTGNGPCEVVERGLDEYETVAREWGWDRASNMLFIDQPVQTGFSYDVPTDGTLYRMKASTVTPPIYNPDTVPSWDLVNGTFSSGNVNNTAGTSQEAALAVWHVIQAFLTTLPELKLPLNASTLEVSLFAESYGGIFAPIFAETWQAQNQNRKRLAGHADGPLPVEIRLASVGIVSGIIDMATEIPAYLRFLNNNTYGIEPLSGEVTESLLRNFTAVGGSQQILAQCAASARQSEAGRATNETEADDICTQGYQSYAEILRAFRRKYGRSWYDIAERFYSPFPSLHFLEYLNQADVLAAIGSPVNFTLTSNAVYDNFYYKRGDRARGGNIDRLAKLLNSGIRIGLMYGDRDFMCNWVGGEAVSLKIAQTAGGEYAAMFPAAGYAPIATNTTYTGGEVRQYGNLSFSRVFQSGHAVASYQPETAFSIFSRIMAGKSISTGETVDLHSFATRGGLQSTTSHTLPAASEPKCSVRNLHSCDDDAWDLAFHGGGVLINGVLYNKAEDWPLATRPRLR